MVKEAGQGIMADYVDYRRALNYRAIDVRASVPSASDVRPDPALWWEGAVVVIQRMGRVDVVFGAVQTESLPHRAATPNKASDRTTPSPRAPSPPATPRAPTKKPEAAAASAAAASSPVRGQRDGVYL